MLRLAYKRIYKPYTNPADLPTIDIIMSVRNEAAVIEKKIHSVFNTSYPHHKITLSIISDASDDNSDTLIKNLSNQYHQIRFRRNETRCGKPSNINTLASLSSADILVFTDANVIFQEHTLFYLIRLFADKRIGLCGAQIKNEVADQLVIAGQEKRYIQIENYLKQWEGECLGSMIGPFGGCYAIRRSLFKPVPVDNAVDDFFIGMSVLAAGKDAVLAADAICIEDIPDNLQQEFNRKRRIANGNYRNLLYFKHLLSPAHPYIAYAFFSHKVIRWFTPHLYLISLLALCFLYSSTLFFILAILQLLLLLAVAIDLQLIRRNIYSGPLRYLTYFCQMNFALLVGFIDFLKGKKAHVWEPTQRT
jgi:cellulose synthase/poly-beta-1,6-N-acetylglucosamine synthase-like glycosyltransferase